jgi:uncharacterized membrane protein
MGIREANMDTALACAFCRPVINAQIYNPRFPLNLLIMVSPIFVIGLVAFHAAVWILICIGITLLFRAGRRNDVPWSGKMLLGSMLIGWGAFNLAEGAIDHEILGIHHVYEYTLDHLPADLAFLAAGAHFLLLGLFLVRRGSIKMAPRSEADLAA